MLMGKLNIKSILNGELSHVPSYTSKWQRRFKATTATGSEVAVPPRERSPDTVQQREQVFPPIFSRQPPRKESISLPCRYMMIANKGPQWIKALEFSFIQLIP